MKNLKEIDILKEQLNNLVKSTNDLLDPRVQALSKKLDELIVSALKQEQVKDLNTNKNSAN